MKKKSIDKYKPAVDKSVLIFLSFFVWFAVGIILLSYAWSWLTAPQVDHALFFILPGIAAALIIHHFGFLKIVDKNLDRILPMQGKRCLFSFMRWKNYIIVVVMISMGVLLRHSPVPKTYLSVLYIGIGFSLILSSIRYLRFLIRHFKSVKQS